MQTTTAQIKFGEDSKKSLYQPVERAAKAFPVSCKKTLLTTIKRHLDIKKFSSASKSYVPYNGTSMTSVVQSIANDGSFKPLDKLFDMLVEMDFPPEADPFNDNLFAAIEAQENYLSMQNQIPIYIITPLKASKITLIAYYTICRNAGLVILPKRWTHSALSKLHNTKVSWRKMYTIGFRLTFVVTT